ncbi:MAG: hypothetical protein H6819_06260 [Phycisphaerales bacterium]|nr:hypothetical protein [Phycisphaerales bacterium]MCB9858576.1 hypothetical protein [Phycisphaerales bacterium]
MTQSEVTKAAIDTRLANVIARHFHPENGAPYWIEKAQSLQLDPTKDIRRIEDLPRLGFMDQAAMRRRPLDDFIPKCICECRNDLIIAQTGGTLGEPIWTAYTPEEYEAAFVSPFVAAAAHVGFPIGGRWLYVGPSGPHIIGQAARSIARATGSRDPFMVDFDARWAKRLPAGSFAAHRYLTHVVEQAMAVIRTQPISHIFSTPPVLKSLAAEMNEAERFRILGVHYGGMAIEADDMAHLQSAAFPRARHLSGYGNTLFGCCLELDASPAREPTYFPQGERLLLGSCGNANDALTIDYGVIGSAAQCVFTRMDETMFIANMLERDEVTIVRPPRNAPTGFHTNGARSPRPVARLPIPAVQSLY